eukprot:XP_001701147.1 predicted protein [Chlamydomonas reinhardtii]
MAGRSLAPVRVLLAARQHATFGAFEMLEMKLVQPTGLYELLLIGQSDTNQPATGYSNVELLPPLAEDCDDAIREYDDLSHRLNQLERPSTMKSAGEQLLAYEVRIASGYALKAARGETLTRRERRQLTRTTADLFRLVPLIIILVVPFLEFALPVLLRLFPNMLPSTFEDKLKKEEEMKRRLAIRLELAKFLQGWRNTAEGWGHGRAWTGLRLVAVISQHPQTRKQDTIRAGAAVENAEIIRFAQLFNDALTLDNPERVQLVSMAQFIKHDDFEIEAEGLENLTEDELRQACRARGMRAPFGEGAVAFMRRQMHDWLDLSLHRGLPSSLLLLSRAFTITASVKDVAAKKDLAYEKLKETLSVIPEEVVEREAAAREARVSATLEALLSLASSSAVARERQVESKIGDRLQLLDTDRDGVVSRQELQAAVSFLRTQMSESIRYTLHCF